MKKENLDVSMQEDGEALDLIHSTSFPSVEREYGLRSNKSLGLFGGTSDQAKKSKVLVLASKQIVVNLTKTPGCDNYTVIISSTRPMANVPSVQGSHVVPYAEFTNQVKENINGKNAFAAWKSMLVLIGELQDLNVQHLICEEAIKKAQLLCNCNAVYSDGCVAYSSVLTADSNAKFQPQPYNYKADENDIIESTKFLVRAYLTQRNKEKGTSYISKLPGKPKQIDKRTFDRILSIARNFESFSSEISDEVVSIMNDHLDYPVMDSISDGEIKSVQPKGIKNPKQEHFRDNSLDSLSYAISRQVHAVLVYCDALAPHVRCIISKLVEKVVTADDGKWLKELRKGEYSDEIKTKEEIIERVADSVYKNLPDWLKTISPYGSETDNSSSWSEEGLSCSDMEVSSNGSSDSDLEDGSRMGGYPQYILFAKRIPDHIGKDYGFYFYRCGVPEKAHVMVIHQKANAMEHICLSDFDDAIAKELLEKIDWRSSGINEERKAAIISNELINLVKKNCKYQHEFEEIAREKVFEGFQETFTHFPVDTSTLLSDTTDEALFHEVKKRLTCLSSEKQAFCNTQLDVMLKMLTDFNQSSDIKSDRIGENLSP